LFVRERSINVQFLNESLFSKYVYPQFTKPAWMICCQITNWTQWSMVTANWRQSLSFKNKS